jgi:hypothetical protein
MSVEKEICRAISAKKQIVYECHGETHVSGERIGNPHILFVTKNDFQMVHIWKTGGVSTNPDNSLPGWRSYHLKNIKNVSILNDSFAVESSFNPEHHLYYETICSV